MAPPIVETRRKIVNVVGNCQNIVNVVGNCESCRRGGGGCEDLKCCRPENFLVCRKKISVWRKSTALGSPPPQKKHGSHGATVFIIANNLIKYYFLRACTCFLKMQIISTDEDPILRIESFAIINSRGVSTKLNLYCCSPCKTTKNLSALLVNNIEYFVGISLE